MKTVIVDDEPLARARLRRLLAPEPDVRIVAECADGPTAVAAVRQHAPDLLLLDVQMPGMDGFATLRALEPPPPGRSSPAVVFVTGFDRHAVRAFEVRALDYLLKPTTRERLAEALARVRERFAPGAADAAGLPRALRELLAERGDPPPAAAARRLAVRTGGRVVFVPVEEVDWVEAAGNYVLLHVGALTHILRETMTALEGQLPAAGFGRVSRSAIVNLRRVRELRAAGPGEHVAVLRDGQRVPITRGVRGVATRLRALPVSER